MEKQDRRILAWIAFLLGIIWSLRSLALLFFINDSYLMNIYTNYFAGYKLGLLIQLVISLPMTYWGASELKIINSSNGKKTKEKLNIHYASASNDNFLSNEDKKIFVIIMALFFIAFFVSLVI
jgi:hypothetical protein